MIRGKKIPTGFALVAALALPAAANPAMSQDVKMSSKLSAMSAEQFQARTQIIDDHLEAEAVISTEEAFRDTRGLFKTPWNDNHLRALIDKRTGAARFEVRQLLRYPGSFRGYDEVSYQTATWPATGPVLKLRDNAQNCAMFDSGEGCFEEVTFTVDEAQLRKIAAGYDSATPGQWSFKFKAGDAYEHRAAIVQAEIVGLLRAVDTYKRGMAHLDAMADRPPLGG